ncbi:hypothetical protein GCM10010458_05220 [Microbacterium luteolum]
MTATVKLAVCFLAGSSASPELSALDAARSDGDELPLVAGEDSYAADGSTSRFVGDFEDVSLWISRGADSPVCLIAVNTSLDEGFTVCGGLPLGAEGLGHIFELWPDDAPAPDGMTRLSENVYAQ